MYTNIVIASIRSTKSRGDRLKIYARQNNTSTLLSNWSLTMNPEELKNFEITYFRRDYHIRLYHVLHNGSHKQYRLLAVFPAKDAEDMDAISAIKQYLIYFRFEA